MGTAPDESFFNDLEKVASKVEGVLGLNDIRAQMLGTHIDAEVHIYVDKKMDIKSAHDIGKKVEAAIEKMPQVHKAWVHIDPFLGKFNKKRRF
jgi:divalent metal cation (Fe/Co/Zn/Cd) transporter